MTTTILATYDGEVFRPHAPPPLRPNTEVRLTVEETPAPEPSSEESVSFLEIAMSLNLAGPPDWAERWDEYLYGERDDHDE